MCSLCECFDSYEISALDGENRGFFYYSCEAASKKYVDVNG